MLNAIYYLIGTIGGAWLTYLAAFKQLPSQEILIGMVATAAIPAFLSIFKSAAKNSDGKFGKETKL